MVCLISLFIVSPALAIPPLPSSFYGTVKVNGENVADGTVIKALINGQVFGTGYTQTYQGDSVYSLDVPGDDSSSTALEGGKHGDVIQFEIAGVLAVETGTWTSATNVNVNLTTSVTALLNTPQATPTPVPTQTPIKLPKTKKAPTSTSSVVSVPTQSLAVATTVVESAPTDAPTEAQVPQQPTESVGQSNSKPTAIVQMSPTPVPPVSPEETDSENNILTSVIGVLLAGGMVWVVRNGYLKRRPNNTNER